METCGGFLHLSGVGEMCAKRHAGQSPPARARVQPGLAVNGALAVGVPKGAIDHGLRSLNRISVDVVLMI